GAALATRRCRGRDDRVMSRPMPTLVMLPPQTPTTRQWAKRLATAVPELSVIVAEDDAEAQQVIADAEAAYGTPPRPPPARATRRRARAGAPRPASGVPAAAGRPPRRLVLPRAHRASRARDELPRDLQRPYRRAHHGLRSRLRTRPASLPAAPAPARVAPRFS